jgi:hypothetical protein
LTLRHSPLAGYPLIDITLSADFDAVMHWLGLDLDRWEHGYDSKEELYEWLASVREGSVLEQGWEVVRQEGLGRMRVDWKRFHTRVDGLPDFIEWLRSNKQGAVIGQCALRVESAQGICSVPNSADPKLYQLHLTYANTQTSDVSTRRPRPLSQAKVHPPTPSAPLRSTPSPLFS